MRPNLSLEYLAATLAALGTGVILAACGGSNQDVKASEVPASKPLPWQGDKACAAHGCGAAPAPSSASTSDSSATSSAPATSAAGGSSATATPSATAAAATTSAPATPAPTSTAQASTPKPAPKPAAKRKPASGDASCGQGTCSSDPKKM
jgi:hypothetical protein